MQRYSDMNLTQLVSHPESPQSLHLKCLYLLSNNLSIKLVSNYLYKKSVIVAQTHATV